MSHSYSSTKALVCIVLLNLGFLIPSLVAQRVTDQLQSLYTFQEGSGSVVYDQAGSLDLTINNPGNTSWISGGGLSINSNATLASSGNASSLISNLQSTNELTVEAWVEPANTTQDGPARIVTLSANTGERNFTLGQENADYAMRLRTNNGGSNNGAPDVYSSGSEVVAGALQHVVFVRNSAGQEKIYVNGSEVYSGTRLGNFSNWASYQFALANELTNDRSWLGELHLVAVYSKDLSATEITQNYNAGSGSSSPCGTGTFDYTNCDPQTITIDRANLTPETYIFTDDDYLGCISYVADDCTVEPSIRVYCADFNLTEPTPGQGYDYGEVTFTRVVGAQNAGYTALEGERMNWIICNGEDDGYSQVEINRAIWYVTGTYSTCNTLCNSAISAVTASNLTGADERVIIYVPDQAGIQPFLQSTCAEECAISASFSTTNAICGTGGSIEVTAEGGTGSYEYRLDGQAWQSSNTFDDLQAGTYSVEVRNDNGTCVTGPFNLTIVNDNTGAIIGFQLEDTGGSNDITITDGLVLNENLLPNNFRLEVLTTGTVGSMVINVSGTETGTATENASPYNYPSGSANWNAGVGTYTIEAIIYSGSNGTGSVCNTQSITFQIVSGTDVPEPSDWSYSCDDGVDVDFYGAGTNGDETSVISIPNPSNIFQYAVEIVYKGGNPGSSVTIQDDSNNFYNMTGYTPPGTSSNVKIYRGLILGSASEITYVDYSNENNLQSIVVYAFRNVANSNASSGTFTSRSGYHDTYTFNLTIPEDFTSRDIVLDLPVSEVTTDCRILNITATAGSVSAFYQLYQPDAAYGPCCLAIPQLVLNDVPGNITTITVEVESPTGSSNSCPVSANQNGQSYVIAGMVALDFECLDCVSFDPGTISGDQSNCGAFDPNQITGTAADSDISVSYQWQSRPGTSGNWNDIAGATGLNYDPSTLSNTTQFRRLATTGDCSETDS